MVSIPRKKKILIDFLCYLPEMADQKMSKKNIISPFVEAGITDKETNIFPIFYCLSGTCKRWVFIPKNIGTSQVLKQNFKDQLIYLAHLHINVGQVTYPDMHYVGIPQGNQYSVSCLCQTSCAQGDDSLFCAFRY